jgi:ABC-type multidrug transport system fused ATPase/permease subunit
MMSLSLDYFETEKTGRIVARMTSDIDALQELISQGLVLFVQNIFLFIGAVIFMLVLSWELALGACGGAASGATRAPRCAGTRYGRSERRFRRWPLPRHGSVQLGS